MKHKIQGIHFVAEHARRRVRACLGLLRVGFTRSADADEKRHEA